MPIDPEILSLIREVTQATEAIKSLHKRLDAVVEELRNDDTEAKEIHRDLERRVARLERWQAKVIGVALGVGIGSGAVSSFIAQALVS